MQMMRRGKNENPFNINLMEGVQNYVGRKTKGKPKQRDQLKVEV